MLSNILSKNSVIFYSKQFYKKKKKIEWKYQKIVKHDHQKLSPLGQTASNSLCKFSHLVFSSKHK